MKEIKLTKGLFALVDDEAFEWLNQWKWCGRRDKKNQYAMRGIAWRDSSNKKKTTEISMHRLIMDAPKGLQVDHIDGNGLNNQRNNLRLCTKTQNLYNRRVNKSIVSGYKGVSSCPKGKPWAARISVDGVERHLGKFDCRHQAARAYNHAATELHGEFACLNIIEEGY